MSNQLPKNLNPISNNDYDKNFQKNIPFKQNMIKDKDKLYANPMSPYDIKDIRDVFPEVTQEEIMVVIARLVNLKSMKRMFAMSPEDFADPKKAVNQVYGSWDEFLYELVTAFFRGGGRINLKPQEGLQGELTPTTGIQQHPIIKTSPNKWAWKKLFEDQNFWDKVSDELTLIIVAALYECTFNKLGRPIYATYGGLPQT